MSATFKIDRAWLVEESKVALRSYFRPWKYAVAATIVVMLIAGCAHTPGPTTRCVTREQFEQIKRDEPPKIADKLSGNAAEDIKPIAGSAVRLRSYARGLVDILGGCVGD